VHDDIPTPEELHRRALQRWRANNETDTASEPHVLADMVVTFGIETEQSPSKRATNWATTLRRYEQFWCDVGRSARENTKVRSTLPTSERLLGEWARYQRRFEDHLTAFQEIRLEVSPAFSWDPVDSAWNARLDACRRHVETTGRLPFLNGHNAEEFALARWLNRQLHQLQTGGQPPTRAARLTELLNPPAPSK
jgi:hypothetical protein